MGKNRNVRNTGHPVQEEIAHVLIEHTPSDMENFITPLRWGFTPLHRLPKVMSTTGLIFILDSSGGTLFIPPPTRSEQLL